MINKYHITYDEKLLKIEHSSHEKNYDNSYLNLSTNILQFRFLVEVSTKDYKKASGTQNINQKPNKFRMQITILSTWTQKLACSCKASFN